MHEKDVLLMVDNAGESQAFDFVHRIRDPLRNVTSIELVSSSFYNPNIYVLLHLSFESGYRDVVTWPIANVLAFDSPAHIHASNRYVHVFRTLLNRLSAIRVRLTEAGGEAPSVPPFVVPPSAAGSVRSDPGTRVALLFKVTCDDRKLEIHEIGGSQPPRPQTSYWIVDNRFAGRPVDDPYDFYMPADFRHVRRIALKEACLLRAAFADEPHVVVHIEAFGGWSFPVFFRSHTHGTYLPYEIMQSVDYIDKEFKPATWECFKGSRVRVTLDGDSPSPAAAGGDIVVLVFEVEHYPRLPPLAWHPTTEKRLLWSRGYGPVLRFRIDDPPRRVRSLALKTMVMPFPVDFESNPAVVLEIADLDIRWTIPFDLYSSRGTLHKTCHMRVLDAHAKAFPSATTLARLDVRILDYATGSPIGLKDQSTQPVCIVFEALCDGI